jgi:hypothetical protein
VTIPIPGGQAGAGKILLEVQGRLEELPAMTFQPERIPTGCRVVVREIQGEHLLRVEPLEQGITAGA